MRLRITWIKVFSLPVTIVLTLLLTTLPGSGADMIGNDEVSRLESSLRKMEDFLLLRQQEEAGTDPETKRLTLKVEAATQAKNAAWKALQEAEYIKGLAYKPFLSNLEQSQLDTMMQKANDDWNNAYNAHEIAESNLAQHQHRIRYVRSRDYPITLIQQHCNSLRQQLAFARQNVPQQPTALPSSQPAVLSSSPPAPYPTSSWSGENEILSEEYAMEWLRRNGYLDANDVPTARFHDWRSQSHSSLNQSGHPLQGISGEFYFSSTGQLEGPVHIMVSPGYGDSASRNGSNGSGQPGWYPSPSPNPPDSPVDEAARSALLGDLNERHKRWYDTYCQKLRSGCAIIPNGVRDELRNWIQKATKQKQIVRCGKLLDCYDSCVMQRFKSESMFNQCIKDCKENIR